MSSTDGPPEAASPASPEQPTEPAPAAEEAPVIEVAKSDLLDDAPVIELGVDAVDLPVPGPLAPPVEAPLQAAPAPEGVAPVVAVEVVGKPLSYRPSKWLLAIVGFVTAAADIGTKEWAKHALAGPDLKRSAKHIEVIPNHLDFIFAQNPGGAWSFLRSVPDGIRRPFFLFVSAAAIVFIVSVYGRLEKRQWAMRWGLPLALGGAIGNLSDRVRYGWVVDFVDVYYKGAANEVHWPTFNVADIAIVVGVGLMALDLLSLRRPHAPDRAEPKVEPASGAA